MGFAVLIGFLSDVPLANTVGINRGSLPILGNRH